MNILITGIHGFVGSNLVYALTKKHSIYGLDIMAPEKKGVLKTFTWDDLDGGVIPEIDAIIHLAGKAHDTRDKSAADIYFKVNTGLTQRIFDWYLQQPSAKKFIFFSTIKSAAEYVLGDKLTEECVPTPVGPYGESKIKAENYIISRYAPEALENPYHAFGNSALFPCKQVYIMRPCMIHGPGNKGNLNLLYSVVSKGLPWPLGAFENRRSFTSIGNLCVVVEGLLNNQVKSGIYHMADDEALSTNEMIEVICKAMGKKTQIWRIPRGLMNGCAKIGGWLYLPLNPLRMQKLTENYVVSNAKIKKALGIDRMPVSAKDGLFSTIESFKCLKNKS